MKLLVIGAGVYVRGIHDIESPLGAFGGAVVRGFRAGIISEVFILSTSVKSTEFAVSKINRKAGAKICRTLLMSDFDGGFVEKTGVRAALIAVPDDFHHSYIKKCGELGLHVLTVKPFVEKVSEARELAALFHENGLIGAVDFHKRFDPANILLKKEVGSSVGQISRIMIDYSQDQRVPLIDFKNWFARSNVFQYLGVHYVDLVFWLTGAKPVEVDVFPSGQALAGVSGFPVWDNIDVFIRWETEGKFFNSIHLTSWAENHSGYCPSRQKIEILGGKCRLQSEQADRGFAKITSTGLSVINPNFCQEFELGRGCDYLGYGIDSVVSFLRSVAQGVENQDLAVDSICTFQDAIVSVEVCESVRSSLQHV